MKIEQYQVDAFASRAFEGNPAAVCRLASWPSSDLLQAIAEENNLAETAFFVPTANGFQLRWFTPVTEVALCGHATLATAHVIFAHYGHTQPQITFETMSGALTVRRDGPLLEMDFPAMPAQPCAAPAILLQALEVNPVEVLQSEDYLVVLENEEQVRAVAPNTMLLAELDLRGVVVTAPGTGTDFVSRFFAPKLGIAEDPVTGSTHCQLTPYWSNKLDKSRLTARQLSKRGGNLVCDMRGSRVLLSGSAITVMRTEIMLDPAAT